MNHSTADAPAAFELVGRFGGFVFTDEGKRRMSLLPRGGEPGCLLKVPKELRRRLIGKFRPGEPIRVAAVEEQDPVTGAAKIVVLKVLPDAGEMGAFPPPVAIAAPTTATGATIRVCTKKHCWRSGGRELWDALGREVHSQGLADRVELRQVGCLGRCKHAPNVDHGRHEHARCSPRDARAILARATMPPAAALGPGS